MAVAAMQCQKHPVVTVSIGPDKPGEARPDSTGERIHEKRTNQLRYELEEGIFEHRPVTMALSGDFAKAGKASSHPMGGG